MPAGGAQAKVIHQLPGGTRVVDVLGPDEAPITWNGQFFGDDAYATALAVDGLRMAGMPLPLTFAGQFRSVLIDHFSYAIRRLPVWVEYRIACVVLNNPMAGPLPSVPAALSTLGQQVAADLAAANAIGT